MESSLIQKSVKVLDQTGPQLVENPLPQLKSGEILVKVMAAACLPIENTMAAGYWKMPLTLGAQGSGVVEKLGPNVPANLLGKKVYVGTSLLEDPFIGVWSNYVIKPYEHVFVVDDKLSFEEVCGLKNPTIAMGMFAQFKKGTHKAAIQTGASSNLGRVVLKEHLDVNVPIINIVRSPQNAQLMKDEGAEYVLNSTDPDFNNQLQELITKLEPTFFYDLVGGSLAKTIFEMMPPFSKLMIFGGLSFEDIAVNPLHMLVNQKTIFGYYWSHDDFHKDRQVINKELKIVNDDLVKGGKKYGIKIAKTFPLKDFKDVLAEQPKLATKGRVVIKPQE